MIIISFDLIKYLLIVIVLFLDELNFWSSKDNYNDILNDQTNEFSSIDEKVHNFIQIRAKLLLRNYENTNQEAKDESIFKLIDTEKKLLESWYLLNW